MLLALQLSPTDKSVANMFNLEVLRRILYLLGDSSAADLSIYLGLSNFLTKIIILGGNLIRSKIVILYQLIEEMVHFKYLRCDISYE
jgi:hypothetical protein